MYVQKPPSLVGASFDEALLPLGEVASGNEGLGAYRAFGLHQEEVAANV
jgi:hypothetical protein